MFSSAHRFRPAGTLAWSYLFFKFVHDVPTMEIAVTHALSATTANADPKNLQL
jgi:hypothetical protein